MKNLEKYIESPPETLFHYTTVDGVFGILSDGEIWATQVPYLNDKEELHHAKKICASYLNDRIQRESGNCERGIMALDGEFEALFLDAKIFVCSFTENGDQLSQWRAYSGNSCGYSIGFGGSDLCASAKKYGFILAKCIYDKRKQRKILEEFLDEFIDSCRTHKSPETLALKAAIELYAMSALMKNPGFKEEGEWRLISIDIRGHKNRINFRKSANSIIPYFSFPFSLENKKESIKKIICGPSPNEEMTKNGLKAFRNEVGHYMASIESSSIPLRKI